MGLFVHLQKVSTHISLRGPHRLTQVDSFCYLVGYIGRCSLLVCSRASSSVGSVRDLRTDGRWFDPRLGQYSFRGLMIVIATGFILLSPLSVVSTMVMWESSQWLGIILCGVLVNPFPHNDTF